MSGKLPSLHVNLSDTKYKSLMRLIDVGIPNFDTGDAIPTAPSPPLDQHTSGAFQSLFGQKGIEYTLDDHDEELENSPKSQADKGLAQARVLCMKAIPCTKLICCIWSSLSYVSTSSR